jgi:hypothetical protein
VALINLYLFSGVEEMSEAGKALVYRNVYLMALAIPLFRCWAWFSHRCCKRGSRRQLLRQGMSEEKADALLSAHEPTAPNWWILGGGLAFVVFTLATGLSELHYGQEIIFAGSFAIVVFLIARLTRGLDPGARATLVGTAAVIFVYRAVPAPGQAITWWMIDDSVSTSNSCRCFRLSPAALRSPGCSYSAASWRSARSLT